VGEALLHTGVHQVFTDVVRIPVSGRQRFLFIFLSPA